MIRKFVSVVQNFDYGHRVVAGIGIAVIFFTLFFMVGGNLVIYFVHS